MRRHTRYRMRSVASLLALVLITGACSSNRVVTNPTADPSASASLAGKAAKKAAKEAAKKAEKKSKKGTNAAEEAIGEAAPGDPGAQAAGSEGDNSQTTSGPLQPLGPGGPQFARKSAHVSEPKPDAEKDGALVPDYAEAIAVDMQGLGDDIRITFTMDGEVPQKMITDQTVMVIAVGISGVKRKDGGFALGAQGRNTGWNAYAGAKNDTREFPGTFFIKGNQIEMTVPWSFLEGPRPFEWYASASWFQNVGNKASYSFDVIPNGKGRFPN